jgi:hypothetical protein
MLAVSLKLHRKPHTSIIGLKHVSVFTTKLSSGNIWFIKSPNCLFHITAHIAIYLVFLISVTHKRLPLLNMHFPVNGEIIRYNLISSNREIPCRSWVNLRCSGSVSSSCSTSDTRRVNIVIWFKRNMSLFILKH